MIAFNQASAFSAEDLASALSRDEFILHYQPQWTADGAMVASVESLVRWDHPTLGLLGPGCFLDAIDRHGLTWDLTERLIARACREALPWGVVPVAVNVPPTEISNPRLLDAVKKTLDASTFPATRLEVEIVESSMFTDYDAAEKTLRHLRDLGIRIALDDFGTGYSSLSLLRRLPIDKVKIDKSFIDDMTSIKSASIIHAVIALARAIGLKITAEGIETVEQQTFLKSAGCHYLQGFLFSRPLPPEAIPDLLERTRPKVA